MLKTRTYRNFFKTSHQQNLLTVPHGNLQKKLNKYKTHFHLLEIQTAGEPEQTMKKWEFTLSIFVMFLSLLPRKFPKREKINPSSYKFSLLDEPPEKICTWLRFNNRQDLEGIAAGIKLITFVFNVISRTGFFSSEWKTAQIIFILKPVKYQTTNLSLVSSIRLLNKYTELP